MEYEQEVAPVSEEAAAVESSDAPGDTSMEEFAMSLPTGSFPLANALRVHMKITHPHEDLRTRAEFAAALRELMGDA